MKQVSTVHAGEYLVGSHIEQHFKHLNVWLPARDTGIDLLITDRRNRRSVSLQVKFSKDFLPDMKPDLKVHPRIRAAGWWKITWSKLNRSEADLWVLVLPSFARREYHFIVVPPKELAQQIRSIHGTSEIVQTYLWVTEDEQCWETRGLNRNEQLKIANGTYDDPKREFTQWLKKWDRIEKLDAA